MKQRQCLFECIEKERKKIYIIHIKKNKERKRSEKHTYTHRLEKKKGKIGNVPSKLHNTQIVLR